ncbi:MAG: SigE family RNA polymerase sigma factor [Pseudonocardiales bacterium]|nr:MAG: SigE family RNA polymerase sigma factor [Pseudonocardiales bacterium]
MSCPSSRKVCSGCGGVDGVEHETTLTRLRNLRRWEPAQAPGERTQALTDIFQQHRVGMLRLARLLVDDQQSAEDVVQDAFAGFYRAYAGLIDPAKAQTYLRSAVLNNARSALRRRRTARAYIPPHDVTARSAESMAMLDLEHQAVVNAIHELPDRQREVLVLRYYEDLSEAEITELTGLARGTVKSTASRALDALERILAARG